MSKKKITTSVKDNDVLTLPSDNKEMEIFIKKNTTHLTEQTITSIEFAINNKLPMIEVFKFNNSDFVITISKKDFLVNVDHIYDFYLQTENYELCSRVVKLQNVLKNLNNSNEKEIEINKIGNN